MRQRRRILMGTALALGIGLVLAGAYAFQFLHSLQLASSDFLFRARNLALNPLLQERIVVIGIDDATLSQMGRLGSWPRTYYARVVDALALAQARLIVLDVIFPEEGTGDQELAQAMERAGNVIQPVLGTPSSPRLTPYGQPMEFEGLLRPRPLLEQASLALGHSNVLPDADGSVRRIPLLVRSAGMEEPALALTAAAKYLRRPQVMEASPQPGHLTLAGRAIPVDGFYRMIVNYQGRATGQGMPFRLVSFGDVLNGQVDPSIFNDKLILIGATASGLADDYWTPLGGGKMNGVEIHANAIETILRPALLQPQGTANTATTIVLLALLAGAAALFLPVVWSTLSIAALYGAYALVAFIAFDRGLMLNMAYPPLALLGGWVGVSLYRVVSEQARRREVLRIFGRYVSPEVVQEIMSQTEAGGLRLGGEEREVTVAFADIRGFTSLSENMRPEEVVRLLNAYLSELIAVVLKHRGMINKFAGDNIMAVWNAPVEQTDHALLAVRAAMEGQEALHRLPLRYPDLPPVEFGIGINTGIAVAGNLGSEDRSEYTVIGDAVNLASRLTGAAPGGRIWIGPTTFEMVRRHVKAEPLEPMAVKGKREPVMIYEIADEGLKA